MLVSSTVAFLGMLQVSWGSQDNYEVVRKVGRGKYSEVGEEMCQKLFTHTFFEHKSFSLMLCSTIFGYTEFELLSTDTVNSGL